MTNALLKKMVCALLLGSASLAWAEDAPVYDVDSYPPQFDGNSGQAAGAEPPAMQAQAPGMPGPASSSSGQSFSAGPGAAPGSASAMPPSAPAYPPADFEQTMPAEPAPANAFAGGNLSMEQRVARLESAVHSDVGSKVAALQAEVQTLRGQVEEINHQLQIIVSQPKTPPRAEGKTQSSAGYEDQDTTVANDAPAKGKKSKKAGDTQTAVNKGLPSATADSKASANQPNVAEEQQIYQTAYNLIKAKKYNDAADTLQKMLQKYPTGQFAANAHYWLGELYSLMGKNDQSLVEFSNVVKNYPDSPKIADAQLKLGLINAAQQKWSEAKAAFKKVINRYPGTASAHLAAEQLKQIKQAGN